MMAGVNDMDFATNDGTSSMDLLMQECDSLGRDKPG
jgi:hypothetical protein